MIEINDTNSKVNDNFIKVASVFDIWILKILNMSNMGLPY